MKRFFYFIFVLAASILAGGTTAYTLIKLNAENSSSIQLTNPFTSSPTNHFTSYSEQKYPDLTYAAENAVKGVVNIEKIEEMPSQYGGQGGRNPLFEFFGMPQQGHGTPQPQERKSGGSGVIISSDGYIVSNNHVIENASKLKVTLNDGSTYDARIIGTDPTTDIALIKIDAENLFTIPFGSSNELRLGEWVLAIGSPFDLKSTVTAGIVSAKARNLNMIPSQFRIESFIQTDAAVNPGNSGGALVNTSGELVGINTMIKSPTGSFTGYSFAVPSSIVEKIVTDIKEYGVVQRAMLGISFMEINDQLIDELGQRYNIDSKEGLYVGSVDPYGAAHDAGIREGDVMISVNGDKITSTSQLLEAIAMYRPNEKVTLSIKREGKMKQFDVTLRNKSGKAELLKKGYVDSFDALGGKFTNITENNRRTLKIRGGAQVVKVEDGGIISKARIKEGFIITQINETQIHSVNDLAKVTDNIEFIDGIYPTGRAASFSLVK